MTWFLAIPFYMLLGPFLVSYMLGGWSVLPIGASIGLVALAGKRMVRAYWLGFSGFVIATIVAFAALFSWIQTIEVSGPEMFDLGFLLGGVIGWLLDLLLIGVVASFLGRRESAQSQGKS